MRQVNIKVSTYSIDLQKYSLEQAYKLNLKSKM